MAAVSAGGRAGGGAPARAPPPGGPAPAPPPPPPPLPLPPAGATASRPAAARPIHLYDDRLLSMTTPLVRLILRTNPETLAFLLHLVKAAHDNPLPPDSLLQSKNVRHLSG